MKSDRKKAAGIAAFLLPFAVMLYMIVTSEIQYRNYPEYRIAITGYDPTNVLTGHYLRFRFQWPENVKNTCAATDSCFACFSGAAADPKVVFVPEKNLSTCGAALQLDTVPPTYDQTARQPFDLPAEYNIPETQADTLDKMLREKNGKFSVGVVVFPTHKGQIKNLYIDNRPARESFK